MDNKASTVPYTGTTEEKGDFSIPNNSNLLIEKELDKPIEIETGKVSEEKNDSSNNNKPDNVKESENNEPKKVRKRATKKESDIRNYKCTLCDKSYLSYPALYTHCKQKHNASNYSLRGRGRPKKENYINDCDPLNETYFQCKDRSGITCVENIRMCLEKAFKFLYENETSEEIIRIIKEGKMKKYPNLELHPFLGKFLIKEHDTNHIIHNEKIPIDFVLMNYLDKMSLYCNEDYYTKLIIFVTLFREHVNYINVDKVEKEHEFSEIREAEDVPESSNEFITEFLFPDDQDYGFGFTKEEIIDLTRNLCNWMYINNFTCSKLFLLEKE